MSGFGSSDRFTDTLSGGPQWTPLYSNQNTKQMPESENKEIKAQRDELISTIEEFIKAYENMPNKSKVHCGDLAQPLTKAAICVAKAKGE